MEMGRSLVIKSIFVIALIGAMFVAESIGTGMITQSVSLATPVLVDNISFAGRIWDVSSYDTFSNDARQVWVDNNGYLHMNLSKATGSWKDVEVVSQDVMGYGTYTWVTDGFKDIDSCAVLGMFPYLDTGTQEVDQEESRWCGPTDPNFLYSVYPNPSEGTTQHQFNIDQFSALPTTYTIVWSQNYVKFNTTIGNTLIQEYTSTATRNAVGVHAITNLWRSGGTAPADGKPIEIVFRNFTYTKGS